MDKEKLNEAVSRMFAASQAGESLTSALFDTADAVSGAELNRADSEFLAAIRAVVRELATLVDADPAPPEKPFLNIFTNHFSKTIPPPKPPRDGRPELPEGSNK